MQALSQHWRGQLLASLCSVPCAAMLGTGGLREGGQRRNGPSGWEPALTPASAGVPGHEVSSHIGVGAQHTQTLTSLSSFCSPDEDSCQKFVPFVGVSVLRGQQGLRGEVQCTVLLMLGVLWFVCPCRW